MSSKKANVTVSFSWVFMIIVGSFFLYLSYNVIDKYQEVEDEKFELQLKSALRNKLTSIGQSTGTEDSSLRKMENLFKNKVVEIDCIGGEIPTLKLDDVYDENNNYLQNYPVFMTTIDEGSVQSTYLAIENYKLPFRVVPLLAIVSTRNLVVFDENSEIWNKFKDKLRKKSAFKSLSFDSFDFSTGIENYKENIKGKAIDTIIFVTDNKELISKTNLETFSQKAYELIIEYNNEQENEYLTGTLSYFDNNQEAEEITLPFVEDKQGSLSIQTMAIFSAPETFKCSYNIFFNHLESSYDFYVKKAENLENMAKVTSGICSSQITEGSAAQKYNSVKNQIEIIKNEISTERFNNADNLKSLLKELDTLYQNNIESKNCIYIY